MSRTASPVEFKCDICKQIALTKRVRGVAVSSRGLEFKLPTSTEVHLCNTCLAGLARLFQESKEESNERVERSSIDR